METKEVSKVRTQLNRYLGTKNKIRIERHFQNNEYLNGFIHDISNDLIVLQQFHDFICDGYTIIRLTDVSSFRSDRYERFFEKILKAEGQLNQVEYKKNIPISSFEVALSYFAMHNENIIIECESLESPFDDEFYIGKVSEIEGDDVWFLAFNALGEWENEEIALKIANVTRVQFDTPYINIFSKYIDRLERD